MSEITELRFRTAVGGFHKSDVTEYIAKTAARHRSELSELEKENQRLRTELEACSRKLEELQLLPDGAPREQAPEAEAASVQCPEDTITALELAAYRRAEHAERTANNRARQLYQQLDQIGLDSQESLSEAREATEAVLNQLNEYLTQLQTPYHHLINQLTSAKARLEAMTDMNPDPAEGMEVPHE